jgi:ABC-type transporter Mla subunit MlaD
MSMSAILIISLAAGVVLVVGGGLMMYMANLVKNAYEIKVQINADMDERINAISDDMDKKSKWIKQELVDELDKIKASLSQSNARTLQEMAEPLSKRIEAVEQILKKERTDLTKAIEDTRQGNTGLDAKLVQFRKDLRRIEEKLGLDPTSASLGPPPKATPPDQPEGTAPAGAAAPAAADKPKAPPTSQKVASILPDLS